MTDNKTGGIRLNKYLAQCGICSRRDADKLIEQGRVSVNGQIAVNGMTVRETDDVRVNGKPVHGREGKKVLAFYKPVGVTCTERDAHAEKLISDIVKYPVRLTYAGRLDRDSEGLLLLTNDGDLIEAMMHGANRHEKEYLVKVNKEVTDAFLETMTTGIYLKELEVTTRPCIAERVGKYTFRIILTQGLNRQIRRMCLACGFRVETLKRVRVMNIELGALRPGQYRELGGNELASLYRGCGLAGPDC